MEKILRCEYCNKEADALYKGLDIIENKCKNVCSGCVYLKERFKVKRWNNEKGKEVWT